ncbi:MAG TPA: alpha/beta hydrolase [Rhodanobacteraceae bacterium]|nr:alpha/beta hydrolase [Rhodanobacteraceae bacterium]
MKRRIGLLIALSCVACGCSAQGSDPSPRARTQPASVETGTLAGADYRIDLPADWNHGLVVWFHGYAVTPVQLPARDPIAPQLRQFLDRGYAVAQSAYSATGWAVEQGVADAERLRAHFGEKHGKPRETFAAGMSMGGTLTVMSLESAPDTYAGGLSLCGAIERSDSLLQRDFALLAAFDYYFPGVLGPLVPVPANYLPTQASEKQIASALAAKPDAAESLLRIWGVGDVATLGSVVAFNYYEVGELQRRTHGNPFNNADLIYTGNKDAFALNAGVKRYRAEAAAAAYIARWYTPSGKLLRPLLALHDTGDPLVPATAAFDYALAVQRAGHADNFVQQFVNKEGHCVFTPQEIGRAFDELVAWVHDNKRPVSGPLPPPER